MEDAGWRIATPNVKTVVQTNRRAHREVHILGFVRNGGDKSPPYGSYTPIDGTFVADEQVNACQPRTAHPHTARLLLEDAVQ